MEFVRQRPFADSASAKLIAVLAPRLPTSCCVDRDDDCYFLCYFVLIFARSE